MAHTSWNVTGESSLEITKTTLRIMPQGTISFATTTGRMPVITCFALIDIGPTRSDDLLASITTPRTVAAWQ